MDEHQVGPDVAIPVISPLARQRMIEGAARQRLIRGRKVQQLHQTGVQPLAVMP